MAIYTCATGAASFDAVICRLGLLLFASPADALSAGTAALEPGTRLAALVFTTPVNNPFMAVPMAILRRHADAPPPAPGTPGLFALGAEGALGGLLAECGLSDVSTSTMHAPYRLPSADDALHMFQEAAGAYRAVVAHLSAADRAAARADVRESLVEFVTPDGVTAELELINGSGARPV